jgi:hypothetical protein
MTTEFSRFLFFQTLSLLMVLTIGLDELVKQSAYEHVFAEFDDTITGLMVFTAALLFKGEEVEGDDWNRRLALIILIAAVAVPEELYEEVLEVFVVIVALAVFRQDDSTSSRVRVTAWSMVSNVFNLYSTVVLRGWITLSFVG